MEYKKPIPAPSLKIPTVLGRLARAKADDAAL